jgi:hypothetical protein
MGFEKEGSSGFHIQWVLRRKGPLVFTSNGFCEGRDLWLSHPMGFEKEGSSGFHIQWVLRRKGPLAFTSNGF